MNKGLIACVFPILFAASGIVYADDELEAIAGDCTMEGEAAGMSGKALEDFVKECVEDISGVSFDNQVGPEDAGE